MRTLALASALVLAACSGGEDGNNSSDAAGQVVEQTPSNLQEDPTNQVVPLSPTAAAPAPSPTPVATTLPPAMQGRWGMVANDCDPAMADAAKGLMTITGDALRFYESRARVTAARQLRPNTLELDLAFTGEGQEWNRRSTLTLVDDGRTLVRETPDDPEPPMRSLRYLRCPAAGGAA